MIRVTLPSPPPHYKTDVKDPGEAFIRAVPNPRPEQWDTHRFWRLIHQGLYDGLQGICCYSASWSPRRSRGGDDHTSIDHFIPKGKVPGLAYAWGNFRLCRERLNNRKKGHFDVLDPCGIQNGVFIINFSTFRVEPGKTLPQPVARRVNETIDRLGLNTDRDYVNERMRIVRAYSLDQITANYVNDRYPFIGQQMTSQNFDVTFKAKWRAFFLRTNIRP